VKNRAKLKKNTWGTKIDQKSYREPAAFTGNSQLVGGKCACMRGKGVLANADWKLQISHFLSMGILRVISAYSLLNSNNCKASL